MTLSFFQVDDRDLLLNQQDFVMTHVLYSQLPEELLRKIFVLVVLEDGDPANCTLALTCRRFWEVVRQEYFLQEAHFAWLDSKLCVSHSA